MTASLIGRLGSSTFRLSTMAVFDIAHGLALLFGIGTKALPLWDSRTRRNNLWVGLAVLQTVGPSGPTNSPHPSSREGHHSTARWISGYLIKGSEIGAIVAQWPQSMEVTPTQAMVEAVQNRMGGHVRQRNGVQGVQLISADREVYFKWDIHDYFEEHAFQTRRENRRKRASAAAKANLRNI